MDLKHRKIRVNAVSPGPIETPAFNRSANTEEEIRKIKSNLVAAVPMGRIGTADEIAKAVPFLASDDSSYITGIELCRWRYGTNLRIVQSIFNLTGDMYR